MSLTPARINEISQRADDATRGPWKLWGMTVMSDAAGAGNVDDAEDVAFTVDRERGLRTFNAAFIAHAREDVPVLLDAVAAVLDLHEPVKFYDECECPVGIHPDEYEYVDVDEYVGCENSLIGYGCRHCCTHNGYTNEQCVHGEAARHDNACEDACPTRTAITRAGAA